MGVLLLDGIRTAFVWIMDHLLVINIIFSILIIFFHRKKPMTVWAWLLVLYCLPVVGFVLYLILGQNFRKERMFRAKEIEGELKYAVRRQEATIMDEKLTLKYPDIVARFKRLILYNLNEGQAVATDNNDIRIFTDGEAKFETLLWEMDHARSYIHLEYYIIKNDELWARVEEVLLRKAKQGVKIRVLFDSMGCRGMRTADWERLEKAGIQVVEFFPALFGNFQMRINYRNHRKIVVIDGRVGFVGGFNIGREYIGKDPKFGYWRDTHICIEGAAVITLAVRFILDWNYAAKENLFLDDSLFEVPVYERGGNELVQIISSGPDSTSPVIRNNYLRMIYLAKKSIYIQTPYFIPDSAILDALKIAVRSGVEVNIMVPCKPDHPFVYWATYSYLGDMIMAGANCYTYDPGFIHAKSLTIDGQAACLGTANMDIRSFELNFEVNATIYSEKTTQELDDAFREDVKVSTLITKQKYQERRFSVKVKEQVCRLLSPLL